MMILTQTYSSIRGTDDIALTVVLAIICIVVLGLLVYGIIECYRK